MKTIAMILFFGFTSGWGFGETLPTEWRQLTQTDRTCQVDASFWELTSSPFALLMIHGEDETRTISMVSTRTFSCVEDACPERVYESVSSGDGLNGFPMVTVDIPSSIESHLPLLTISYSGVQIKCSMDWSGDWSGDEFGSSNAGSIGHGR